MTAIRQKKNEDAISIDVLVQPRASRARVGPRHGDRIKIAVTAPPVDGAANAAVVRLLSKSLGLPKSAITVTHGHSSRRKTVRVAGATPADIEALL